jgi:hypothetical protein
MNNDLILYSTEDGQSQFVLRQLGEQVWLSQLEIAELYQSSKQNISKHIKSVIADGELAEAAVVNSMLTTASDRKKQSLFSNTKRAIKPNFEIKELEQLQQRLQQQKKDQG